MTNETYQPSKEEINKDEEMMTDEQKRMNNEREQIERGKQFMKKTEERLNSLYPDNKVTIHACSDKDDDKKFVVTLETHPTKTFGPIYGLVVERESKKPISSGQIIRVIASELCDEGIKIYKEKNGYSYVVERGGQEKKDEKVRVDVFYVTDGAADGGSQFKDVVFADSNVGNHHISQWDNKRKGDSLYTTRYSHGSSFDSKVEKTEVELIRLTKEDIEKEIEKNKK